MENEPGSAGTTVTVFGDSDRLGHALNSQLHQRGCKTHFVSVPTGWLRTATHVVVRLDTNAGVEALNQLAASPAPRSHVIAVCPESADPAEADRFREMCRACGVHHDVALIVHPRLDADAAVAQGAMPAVEVARNAVAATVAAEMVAHSSVGQPAFVTKSVRLEGGHRPSISLA